MEALTAVAVACLTVYDMVKSIDRGMSIEGVMLLKQDGRDSRRLCPARPNGGSNDEFPPMGGINVLESRPEG